MDIDLLFTNESDAGLISNQNLIKKVAGALLDTESGVLTLEYNDMDIEELNIPVEREFFDALDMCAQIHIGAIKEGQIAQAYQIPLMFADDPYRTQTMMQHPAANMPLQAFEAFVKACVTGQPVHRDDLGNEDSMGCVLGDASPQALQFAPHLARRHAMEISPKAAPGNTPRFSGPGLGSSSSGNATYTGRRDDKGKT